MPTETTIESGPARRTSAARPPATELVVSGMTCGNCVRHVTAAIQNVPGVHSTTVNLEAARATVRWGTEVDPDVAAVISAVRKEGFGARMIEAEDMSPGAKKLAGWQLNLWIGLPITALLMVGEWAMGFGLASWFQWLSFGLAGVVQVFAGARFYRGAWGQLKVGSSNMDTLVSLGSTTAFGYSAWALLAGHGGHVYFMEAASIITLISVGHWAESLVSVRASDALRQLLDLAPARARRKEPDGTELEVAVNELRLGDVVLLRAGDRVPTDGEVVEGNSAVDESMLTGESVPVDKAKGNAVYTGTVNLNGRLALEVTATGEGTALAHIIAAVQRAQNSRAGIQRLADRVSNIFVPIVVLVALSAALWWGLAPASASAVHAWLGQFLWPANLPAGPLATVFMVAAAVLIIACPCAMGLATPAAIMAGSNAAARLGILIRDGVALEKAGNVTAVVFDKTGTLTRGQPAVAAVWLPSKGALSIPAQPPSALPRFGPEVTVVLELAAALGQHSTHPISRAVFGIAEPGTGLDDWQEVPGAGIQAKLMRSLGGIEEPGDVLAGQHKKGATARLGSLRWLKESGVDLAKGDSFIRESSAQGATLVGLAAGRSLLGLFAVKDSIKDGAPRVIRELRQQGLRAYMVTGDNPLTAASIAQQVGIDVANVFAEVRPEQKADFVKRLQQQGERVAFVGDGINDAPALEQAELGIAVSRASDIAREAADIILLNSEIEAVPQSLGLARATLRTIKQNLFWAFFYNGVGIPLAALGFMSPILCAAAMGVSDIVVIGNALRLRRWRLKKS